MFINVSIKELKITMFSGRGAAMFSYRSITSIFTQSPANKL